MTAPAPATAANRVSRLMDVSLQVDTVVTTPSGPVLPALHGTDGEHLTGSVPPIPGKPTVGVAT